MRRGPKAWWTVLTVVQWFSMKISTRMSNAETRGAHWCGRCSWRRPEVVGRQRLGQERNGGGDEPGLKMDGGLARNEVWCKLVAMEEGRRRKKETKR